MISSDIQKLQPGSLVELFQLDYGSPVATLRFHAGVNELGFDIMWQGNVYTRFPIQAIGFEWSGQGAIPRPKIQIANVTGLIGALIYQNDDLIGSKITRRRTFLRYLDAVNFTSGNANADPYSHLPDEIFFIDRKSAQNKIFVEFELAAAWDVQGIKIPRRQCIQNTCIWSYRGAECSYAGPPVSDINDVPTTDPAKDDCGQRLFSCQQRFGVNDILPYGGFPGAGLVR